MWRHELTRCHAGAGMKYTVKVSRRGPQSFRVFLGNSHVDVVARKLNDGGLLVQVRSWLICCISLTLLERFCCLILALAIVRLNVTMECVDMRWCSVYRARWGASMREHAGCRSPLTWRRHAADLAMSLRRWTGSRTWCTARRRLWGLA